MTAPAPANVPGNPWTSLDPYAQVLRALLPRMTHLSVFNASGDLHWSSEMSVDSEVLNLIPETLRAAASNPSGPGQQAMAGQEQVYLFWLRRDDGMPNATPFAIVVLGTRGSADTERRAFLLRLCDGQASDRVPAARADGA